MRSLFPVAILALLLLTPAALRAQSLDLEAVKKKIAEKIEPLTEEQLNSSVPMSYWFNYPSRPQPGKRVWKRLDADTWHEVYPDNKVTVFKVLGHARVKGQEGTVVVKMNKSPVLSTGDIVAFIPDLGSKVMHHLYINLTRGDKDWNDLADMHDVTR